MIIWMLKLRSDIACFGALHMGSSLESTIWQLGIHVLDALVQSLDVENPAIHSLHSLGFRVDCGKRFAFGESSD